MKLLRNTILITLTLSISGCATFGKKEAPKSPDTLAQAAQGDIIVQQPRSKDAVVSKFNRDYWLGIRNDATSSIMRMHASMATGEAKAAEDLARTYLQKNPKNIDALSVLAASLVLQKNYALAEYYAKQIEKQVPGHPVASNIRGLATMLKGSNRIKHFRKAKEYFANAFDGDGDQIAPGLNLGHLQLELGDAAGAFQTFAEVAKRCKKCEPAQMGAGIAASRIGNKEAAVAALKSVLDKNPNNPKALYHLALVYSNLYNDGAKAQELLSHLLYKVKTDDLALKERADAVYNQMQGEKSIEERSFIADDSSKPATSSGSDSEDAEAMMSSFEED